MLWYTKHIDISLIEVRSSAIYRARPCTVQYDGVLCGRPRAVCGLVGHMAEGDRPGVAGATAVGALPVLPGQQSQHCQPATARAEGSGGEVEGTRA